MTDQEPSDNQWGETQRIEAPQQPRAGDDHETAEGVVKPVGQSTLRFGAGSTDHARGAGLRVRCPACQEYVSIAPDANLFELVCRSCGSDFNLVHDDLASCSASAISCVGHFRLIQRIGMGAFGAVWKAFDTKLERTVALKIPRKGQFDIEQEKAFLREAQNAAQLNHPGIVPVYEVGRDGDTLYIVCEFVRGVTMADWLTGRRPNIHEACDLLLQLAEALHHAHQRGVVHRDLKPGNIMLNDEGRPFLMDFGLASRESLEPSVTLDGQVIGTPAYMSPEQAQGKSHHADRRSDVYSLGVVLYQMLTGEMPFRGNTRMLMHQVIYDPPPPLRKLNRNVPKPLEMVCLKALSKDPNRRYQDAHAMAEDVRRYLTGQPVSACPSSWLQHLTRWLRNPDRVREAGAFSIFIAILLFTWNALGVAVSALLLERLRTAEAVGALITFAISSPGLLAISGVLTMRYHAIGIWLGLITSGVSLICAMLFMFQEFFGLPLDIGGIYTDIDARTPLAALLLLLAFYTTLTYVAAAVAFYANRTLMRWSASKRDETSAT